MSTKETGWPAFPVASFDHQTFQPKTVDEVKRLLSGMTLRDYFAAKALQGAMTRESFSDGFDFIEKAVWVYAMADAMLEARK